MTRRRTRAKLTVHVSVDLKAELRAVAEEYGVSESAACLALIEEGLRARVEHRHGALLEAAVERTIRTTLANHLERLGDFAFRAALDSDETRRLVIALCFKALGTEPAK